MPLAMPSEDHDHERILRLVHGRGDRWEWLEEECEEDDADE